MNVNEVQVAVVFGVLSVVISIVTWIVNQRIKNEILVNNQDVNSRINALDNDLEGQIDDLKNENEKQLRSIINLISNTRIELNGINKELVQLQANLGDKVLAIVNSKYVRTELHTQAISALDDRISSIRQLLELHMVKLEENLDNRVKDLKERLQRGC